MIEKLGLASNFCQKKYNMNDPEGGARPQLLAKQL